MQKRISLIEALTGEERPLFMGGSLSILVLLLHIKIGFWLLRPSLPAVTPKTAVMEVSLVSMTNPKVEIVPLSPSSPPPPKPKLELPKKQSIKKVRPITPVPVAVPKNIVDEKPLTSAAPPPAAPAFSPPVDSRPVTPVVNDEPKISTGVVPLERVPPKYPVRAASRHIEGWVKVEFTISTSGTVENAVVVDAQPPEVFDEAALKAINQWTFKEKIVNGVAVEQRAVQTLQFKLTK